MRKLYIHSTFLLVFFTSVVLQSFGQITVTKVENKNINPSSIGFYYSLPQTVLKIDIVYEKIQQLKGPLSSYTNEYLGVADFINSDKIEYNPIDVDVSTYQESDANQLYFVQFPTEKLKDAKESSFLLSNIGGLLAYNTELAKVSQVDIISSDQTFIFREGDNTFPYMSQYNKRKKVDTIIRTINIDTVVINRFLFNTSWIDKSASDKAKDAAMQIERIRESRYNLISGYQEINYGSSIVYMDQQLKKMETQYLELFLGRNLKTIEKRTIYFVPGNNNKNAELINFTDGRSVVIRITPEDISGNISESSGSKINNIFYRIPASADITISSGNINFFTGRFVVNQYGAVSSVPLANTKLQFDGQTGNLINMVKE